MFNNTVQSGCHKRLSQAGLQGAGISPERASGHANHVAIGGNVNTVPLGRDLPLDVIWGIKNNVVFGRQRQPAVIR